MNVKGRHWPTEYPFRRVEKHGGEVLVTDDGFRLEPQPGDFRYRDEKNLPTNEREKVEYFEFYCPSTGRYCGMVRCANLIKPAKIQSWALVAPEGDPKKIDLDHPTLTPSINCVGGCGWHGRIESGEFKA